jgi:glycosyltransferase involved in cell wall biosynthesis
MKPVTRNIIYIQCASMYPIGGIDRVVINIANMWSDLGYDVRLLSVRAIQGDAAKLIKPEILEASAGFHGDWIKRFPHFVRLWAYVCREGGVVVGLWPEDNIRASLLKALMRRRVRVLISEHCDYRWPTPRTRALCNWTYKFADCSWTLARSSYRPTSRNNLTIPNFISTSSLRRAASHRENLFVALGHLIDRKNFVEIVRAIHHLRDLFEAGGWKVEIYGTGPNRSPLEAEIGRQGLSSYIKLCGYGADAYKQLARSKCLILSSKSEAFPMVFLEALALGNFVITSRFSGAVNDIFREPAFFGVYEMGKPEQLAEEIRRFIKTYASEDAFPKVAAENERYFQQHFSEEAVSPLWRDALSGILFNHDPATSGSQP